MADKIEWTAGDLEDAIADAIYDSLDMDWTGRDGARHVIGLPIIAEVPAMVAELRSLLAMQKQHYGNGARTHMAMSDHAKAIAAILARIDGEG